jgi:ParB-like chromosome segregation protein Spo0J
MAYDALIEKFALTQDQIAKQVGKSRSAVANTLRLLDLPEVITEMVKEGKLSAGHARTLLPLADAEVMETAANRIIARSLSVRDAEALVKRLLAQEEAAEQARQDALYEAKFAAKQERKKVEKTIDEIDKSLSGLMTKAADAKAKGYNDVYRQCVMMIKVAKGRRMQAEKFLFQMDAMQEIQNIEMR